MSYTQSFGVSGALGFLNILSSSLSQTPGWTMRELNSSSAASAIGRLAREIVFHTTGTTDDPCNFYMSVFRHRESNPSGIERIGYIAFSGMKNFENPVPIISLSRTSNTITAQCSAPHNLVAGDKILVNGNASSDLNEGWDGSLEGAPRSGHAVISLPTTSSFTYRSNNSVGNSAAGGFMMSPYGTTAGRHTGVNDGMNILPNASYDLFMYYDSYRVCGILSSSGNQQQLFYIGETARDHIPYKWRDRAYITTDIGPGAVTASLNRNIRLKVGQPIWFVHLSGTAGSSSFERTTITSVPSSASFGCMLTNFYCSGSIVGEDPVPVIIMGAVGTVATTAALSARSVRSIFHVNCTVDPIRPGELHTFSGLCDSGASETAVDPDAGNFLVGRYNFISRATPPAGVRGRLVGLVSFAVGPQADKDIIRTGVSSSANDYKHFIGVPSTTPYCVAIGPGAT